MASVTAAAAAAAPKSGIYAYAETSRIHGLPRFLRWVYIGKSDNIQRRLHQHAGGNETNAALRRWLQRSAEKEVWYSHIDSQYLDVLERDLVTNLEPTFNVILYRSHANRGEA